MSGYYHQDERDGAVVAGCLVIVMIAALVIGIIIGVVSMAAGACASVTGDAARAELDGSNAGANAVRVEELQCEGSHPCQ